MLFVTFFEKANELKAFLQGDSGFYDYLNGEYIAVLVLGKLVADTKDHLRIDPSVLIILHKLRMMTRNILIHNHTHIQMNDIILIVKPEILNKTIINIDYLVEII